ncbi:MAG: hypothetical protein WBW80_15425 [Acidimicrobiales bacterium]
MIRLGDSITELLVMWRRQRVSAALRRADGEFGSPSEQRVIDAYDRLIEAEHRKNQ